MRSKGSTRQESLRATEATQASPRDLQRPTTLRLHLRQCQRDQREEDRPICQGQVQASLPRESPPSAQAFHHQPSQLSRKGLPQCTSRHREEEQAASTPRRRTLRSSEGEMAGAEAGGRRPPVCVRSPSRHLRPIYPTDRRESHSQYQGQPTNEYHGHTSAWGQATTPTSLRLSGNQQRLRPPTPPDEQLAIYPHLAIKVWDSPTGSRDQSGASRPPQAKGLRSRENQSASKTHLQTAQRSRLQHIAVRRSREQDSREHARGATKDKYEQQQRGLMRQRGRRRILYKERKPSEQTMRPAGRWLTNKYYRRHTGAKGPSARPYPTGRTSGQECHCRPRARERFPEPLSKSIKEGRKRSPPFIKERKRYRPSRPWGPIHLCLWERRPKGRYGEQARHACAGEDRGGGEPFSPIVPFPTLLLHSARGKATTLWRHAFLFQRPSVRTGQDSAIALRRRLLTQSRAAEGKGCRPLLPNEECNCPGKAGQRTRPCQPNKDNNGPKGRHQRPLPSGQLRPFQRLKGGRIPCLQYLVNRPTRPSAKRKRARLPTGRLTAKRVRTQAPFATPLSRPTYPRPSEQRQASIALTAILSKPFVHFPTRRGRPSPTVCDQCGEQCRFSPRQGRSMFRARLPVRPTRVRSSLPSSIHVSRLSDDQLFPINYRSIPMRRLWIRLYLTFFFPYRLRKGLQGRRQPLPNYVPRELPRLSSRRQCPTHLPRPRLFIMQEMRRRNTQILFRPITRPWPKVIQPCLQATNPQQTDLTYLPPPIRLFFQLSNREGPFRELLQLKARSITLLPLEARRHKAARHQQAITLPMQFRTV